MSAEQDRAEAIYMAKLSEQVRARSRRAGKALWSHRRWGEGLDLAMLPLVPFPVS